MATATGGILGTILQLVTMAQALLGSAAAQKILDALTRHYELTPEQKANLDANYQDYIERIARLKAGE